MICVLLFLFFKKKRIILVLFYIFLVIQICLSQKKIVEDTIKIIDRNNDVASFKKVEELKDELLKVVAKRE